MSPRIRRQAACVTFSALSGGEAGLIPPEDEGFSEDRRVGTGVAVVRQASPIRVLLMSDRPIEREGIRLIITNQPDMVLAGCAGVDLGQRDAPDVSADVILLDMDTETGNVLELLPRIATMAGRGRVLVLVSPGRGEVARRVACLGAMGVVSKDQGVETLMKAIRKVHSGEIWFDRAMVADIIRQIALPIRNTPDEDATSKISALTKREREVVRLLGQGLNAEAIAKRLCISETTARHHLGSILGKLEVRDRFDLVFYAYRHRLAVPPARSELSNSA